jgi:hypothetical protein
MPVDGCANAPTTIRQVLVLGHALQRLVSHAHTLTDDLQIHRKQAHQLWKHWTLPLYAIMFVDLGITDNYMHFGFKALPLLRCSSHLVSCTLH